LNSKFKIESTFVKLTNYSVHSRLFWSDWNREYPKIEFAGLDGQGREILVGEGLALPNSLVIDPEEDQLCWADAGTHQIGKPDIIMSCGKKPPVMQ